MVRSWWGERRLEVAERFQTDVGSRGVVEQMFNTTGSLASVQFPMLLDGVTR